MQALFWSGFPSGEIGGNCGKGGKGGYKAGIGIVLNFELPNFKIIFFWGGLFYFIGKSLFLVANMYIFVSVLGKKTW